MVGSVKCSSLWQKGPHGGEAAEKHRGAAVSDRRKRKKNNDNASTPCILMALTHFCSPYSSSHDSRGPSVGRILPGCSQTCSGNHSKK